jgi:pyruvate/2-oxoglutarate dehydrogenase complex dihydrolipoamide acyltransferase (E2) component
MQEVILMPRLSDTMTEGVIAAWHKNVGDKVKKGDILAEIETDKATMELESYKNGTLLYQGAAKGEKIQVNDLLCIIGEKGKVDVDAVVAAAKGHYDEIAQHHPYLDTSGIKAAFLTVSDGHVSPSDITHAMAAGARQLGAAVYRRTRAQMPALFPGGFW